VAGEIEDLLAYVRREIREVFGADARHLRRGDLDHVEHRAREWLTSPWAEAKIKGYIRNKKRAVEDRKALDAAVEVLARELEHWRYHDLDRDESRRAKIPGVITLLCNPHYGEVGTPLRLGQRAQQHTAHACLIAIEIWKVWRRLDERGYNSTLDVRTRDPDHDPRRPTLGKPELDRVGRFITNLFAQFGDFREPSQDEGADEAAREGGRHGKTPPLKGTIMYVLRRQFGSGVNGDEE
jgi:hypothetical protein